MLLILWISIQSLYRKALTLKLSAFLVFGFALNVRGFLCLLDGSLSIITAYLLAFKEGRGFFVEFRLGKLLVVPLSS